VSIPINIQKVMREDSFLSIVTQHSLKKVSTMNIVRFSQFLYKIGRAINPIRPLNSRAFVFCFYSQNKRGVICCVVQIYLSDFLKCSILLFIYCCSKITNAIDQTYRYTLYVLLHRLVIIENRNVKEAYE
jgi:hypothetical protein